jgi:hypothetical protein
MEHRIATTGTLPLAGRGWPQAPAFAQWRPAPGLGLTPPARGEVDMEHRIAPTNTLPLAGRDGEGAVKGATLWGINR